MERCVSVTSKLTHKKCLNASATQRETSSFLATLAASDPVKLDVRNLMLGTVSLRRLHSAELEADSKNDYSASIRLHCLSANRWPQLFHLTVI
jgi:hypothetical protein